MKETVELRRLYRELLSFSDELSKGITNCDNAWKVAKTEAIAQKQFIERLQARDRLVVAQLYKTRHTLKSLIHVLERKTTTDEQVKDMKKTALKMVRELNTATSKTISEYYNTTEETVNG